MFILLVITSCDTDVRYLLEVPTYMGAVKGMRGVHLNLPRFKKKEQCKNCFILNLI